MDRKPNRRKRWDPPSVGTLATGVAVAYATFRLVQWAWGDSKKEKEGNEAVRSAWTSLRTPPMNGSNRPAPSTVGFNTGRWRLRRQRMTRCREDTLKALNGFLPTLRRIIERETDTTQVRKALKKIRAARDSPDYSVEEERLLWATFKVRSMTQMIATAYAHTILFLVLSVQVNLLGGRLFYQHPHELNTSNGITSDDKQLAYQTIHRFVLTHTYEFFFQRGLTSLTHTVERAVTDMVADWDVLAPTSLRMTRESVEEAISKIRAVVEGGRVGYRNGHPRNLMRFLMPPSASLEVVIDYEQARSILDETWDLIESPVFADAQYDSLTTTFDILREKYWGSLFEPVSELSEDSQWTTKPLATVITKMQKSSQSFYEDAEPDSVREFQIQVNPYCAVLQTLPSVLELGDVSFN